MKRLEPLNDEIRLQRVLELMREAQRINKRSESWYMVSYRLRKAQKFAEEIANNDKLRVELLEDISLWVRFDWETYNPLTRERVRE